MLPFLWHRLRMIFLDEATGKTFFGVLAVLVGATLIQVFAWGWDDVKEWTRQEWAFRIGASMAVGIGMKITGQRNASGEKLLAAIEEAQAARKSGKPIHVYRREAKAASKAMMAVANDAAAKPPGG